MCPDTTIYVYMCPDTTIYVYMRTHIYSSMGRVASRMLRARLRSDGVCEGSSASACR